MTGLARSVLLFNWRDLSHPDAGGAEVYTWEVLKRIKAAGHRVCWFASHAPGLPHYEKTDGIDIVRAGGRLSVYRAARKFWEHEHAQFDLVIDEVNTRPFLTPRFIRSKPIVALIHQVAREVWFSELPWPVAAAGRFILEPWWLRSYRHVPTFTVSSSSAHSLRQYGLRLVGDIGVGIDFDTPGPILPKEPEPTVLFVGRMAASKRPDHILEAMRQVWRSEPRTRLWMVGDGPMVQPLRRRAEHILSEIGLPVERARFTGRVTEEEKLELMTRAWVLTLASTREGWGLVVDEAARCGTATIGYRVPGLVDSVPAAQGVLVEPNPQALGEALYEAASRDDLAGRVIPGWHGGAASWDDVAARFAKGVRLATCVSLDAAPPLGSAPAFS